MDAVAVLVEVLDAVVVDVPNRADCVGTRVGCGVKVALTERVLVFDCVDDAVFNALPTNNWRTSLTMINVPCVSRVDENDDSNNVNNKADRILFLSGEKV